MNQRDDLDRLLTAWLDDPFTPPAPRYLGEVLEQTRHTRQRRSWASLERWLPMAITLRRPMLAPPLRLLATGLALLLFVGAAFAAAGWLARFVALPAVVDVAQAPGLIAYEQGGDVWTYDPDTGRTERIAENAGAPSWSPSGEKLFFWRADGFLDLPMVIDLSVADPAPVSLTQTGLIAATGMSWGRGIVAIAASPDGSVPRIRLMFDDGSGSAGLPLLRNGAIDSPAFQPYVIRRSETGPTIRDGGALLYREGAGSGRTTLELASDRQGGGEAEGRYLATDQVDTSVGPLTDGFLGVYDLLDPTWAPPAFAGDDQPPLMRIAYHQLHDVGAAAEADGNGFRVHVFDGVSDRALTGDPQADDEGWAAWDPTGGRVAFQSFESTTGTARLVIMRVDDDQAPVVVTDPIVGPEAGGLAYAWSPDGTRLILMDHGASRQSWMVDAATGTMTPLPIPAEGTSSWAVRVGS